MAKKRGMPHGRSVPKDRKVKARIHTSVEDVEKGEVVGPVVPTAPQPVFVAPRSAVRSGSFGRVARTGTGLSTDYAYVLADLKRIAILAGATSVVLFGLTFVIR